MAIEVKGNVNVAKQKDVNGLKFKKQFSRVSTAAQNISIVEASIPSKNGLNSSIQVDRENAMLKHELMIHHERQKSIDKINEERAQLVGLKSQAPH